MARNNDEPSPADLQKYLAGFDYPASKDELIAAARGNGAPDEVLGILRKLTGDRFDGPPGVMKAYGQVE